MLNSPKIEKTEFYAGKFVKLPPIMKEKHGGWRQYSEGIFSHF